MQTESARMTSAAEARFRVQAPNSLPRAIAVIALDAAAADVVAKLAADGWRHATFYTAGPAGALHDLAGAPRRLDDAIGAADLVVLVAGPGGLAPAAAAVGRACSDRRVTTTAFLVGASTAPPPELSKTLAQLRPWSLMVVISEHDEYIGDMMAALRA